MIDNLAEQTVRVLSLTGGGVRGLYSAAVLSELEDRLALKLSDRFDVIAGTSVGGIIALGLAVGFDCQKILSSLRSMLGKVFAEPAPLNPWGARKRRYSNQALKAGLLEIFDQSANLKISSLQRNIIIPSVDFSNNKLIYFSNLSSRFGESYRDATILDAALATSAAPTYLPAHVIEGKSFVDGGIACNNPDLAALCFALALTGLPVDAFSMLAVGTGKAIITDTSDEGMSAGTVGLMFRHRFLDRLFSLDDSASSETVSRMLRQRYVRFDPPLLAEIKLDCTDPKVLNQLQMLGKSDVGDQWNSDGARIASLIR